MDCQMFEANRQAFGKNRTSATSAESLQQPGPAMGDLLPPQGQPLHRSALRTLHQTYVAFHNEHLAHVPPRDFSKWNDSYRHEVSPIAKAGFDAVPVEVENRTLENFRIRIYKPQKACKAQLPCVIWIPGGELTEPHQLIRADDPGGWSLATIKSDEAILSLVCTGIWALG